MPINIIIPKIIMSMMITKDTTLLLPMDKFPGKWRPPPLHNVLVLPTTMINTIAMKMPTNTLITITIIKNVIMTTPKKRNNSLNLPPPMYEVPVCTHHKCLKVVIMKNIMKWVLPLPTLLFICLSTTCYRVTTPTTMGIVLPPILNLLL
eukprot:15335408-Ditylum_brightwellii.AAC.1